MQTMLLDKYLSCHVNAGGLELTWLAITKTNAPCGATGLNLFYSTKCGCYTENACNFGDPDRDRRSSSAPWGFHLSRSFLCGLALCGMLLLLLLPQRYHRLRRSTNHLPLSLGPLSTAPFTAPLKLQLQTELQGTRRTHGIKLIPRTDGPYSPADKLSKGRVRECSIRKIKVWMVQDIEGVHAKDEI